MFRVITLNLNGIRSAAKKGFFEWMLQQNADVICLQELKAQHGDLEQLLFKPAGYYGFFHCAEKKGYSGVGIYTKQKPETIITGLGWPEADQEGRYIEARFGEISIASIYLPSGTSGEQRQAVKFDFLKRYTDYLKKLSESTRKFIICGDLNIAHRPIDLKNWRGNQKNSGFLPEERAWLDKLFGPLGFHDAFRCVNQAPEQYTWWSHRGQAWTKNVGWRIDYQVVIAGLETTIQSAAIFKDQRFSDHAPLIIDYQL
ncbi:MAG: exoA [Gammaproteobacteria bacterium]|jgi:exodeoxyribonuclease-3|nr:exoA [Gammaproteobacteria bacterium]MDF3055596.1 exoA [Gammaproteobacteria bacterium]